MYNDWLTIGPFTIHGYGVMIAIGMLTGFWLAEKLAREQGLNAEKIDSMIFFIIIFGYACSKLLYIVTVFDQFLSDPMSVLGSGGWVVYGGIIGGALGGWLWCRHYGWDFLKHFNTLVPCVALAQGFGRIGCFFAGCCYGVTTDSFLGVTFPAGSLCPVHEPVIPTQLIMSVGDFLIFFILYRNLKKGTHPENTGAYYMMLYSFGRFMIEFIRGDAVRGFVGIFSTSQFIALFVFLGGLALLMIQKKSSLKKID